MKQINKKGFTLVEIIVVLVIMGILLAIFVPSILGYVEKTNDVKFMTTGRSINTEATTLIQEELIKKPNMSEAEFKQILTKYRRNFIWSGAANSNNPINELIQIDLPDYYQIRAIDFNFDGLYSQNEWIYNKSITNHSITKISILLQKTKTAGTQSPLQEYVYIVTLPNENIYVYDSIEEAMDAADTDPEKGPIFPV